MDQQAFIYFSYGVYIVSVWDEGRPTGCVANSIMQVTAIPEGMAVSINHDNYTHACIEKTGKFSISVLSEQSDPAIIGTFGFRSGKDVDKFEKIEYELKNSLPVVRDSCAYLTCTVLDQIETQTHTVFLARVDDTGVLNGGTPMTYAYYHQVIKGKSPKNAPTYRLTERQK